MGSFVSQPFGAKGRQSRAEEQESRAGRRLLGFGSDLFTQTAGLRIGTVDILQRVLAGERPETFRVFAPEREAVESQFRNVRENILATMPARGGQLSRLLAEAEVGRARTLGELEADVRRRGMEQALGVGFGVPGTAFAGIQGAGGIFGTAAGRAQQDVQAKNQSIGQIAGIAAGLGGLAAI
jgi:hypothetical protein